MNKNSRVDQLLLPLQPRETSPAPGESQGGDVAPSSVPQGYLYSVAMLCWAISLELGRNISRSTSMQVTADSLVMTDLEAIMTGNCLIRTGIFHENNYIDEAQGHFSLESPAFQPSLS